ncbi:hypothetical protein GWI33_011619 [Rhynchophorus ferrugineus]|uniref:Uncharacterized protein n=1 Tax=Rhynchophorus ferrugineus TaxID=354439 RepID=A0A834MBF7_RHYFE|nr:hypothetical protein GWI33_011619 [Rhynchophorus ferrugineus]
MTDDEPMFYNAWINIMNAVDKPRRLLCSWHVIKDWNIQGRNKIKSLEIRNAMKSRMSLIMQETNEETFMNLKDSYFKELEGEGEDVFLKYLQSYYFQNKERIMMWAHCYRVNAGINTNVAIESLNKLLKYDELKGHCNIRVEKLLDVLEEIVNEKVWKTIINTERPNFSSYQQRATMQGHKQAEEITYQIELLGCDEICDEDCRVVIFEQASECDAGPTYEDEDYKDFVMDESSSNNFACKEQLIDVMDNHLNDQIENNLGVSNVAKSHETEEEKCTTRVEEVINNSNACARLNPDKRKKYFDDFDQVTARHLMNRRKIELD